MLPALLLALVLMTAVCAGLALCLYLERGYSKELQQRLDSANHGRRALARQLVTGGNAQADPKKVLAYLKANRVSAREAQSKVAEIGG